MAKNGGKGGSPGRPTPGWDKDWPPKAPQKPKPTPKLAKKNKGKKGDPEAEYSRPLKGAPPGHNIAKDYFTEDNDNPV